MNHLTRTSYWTLATLATGAGLTNCHQERISNTSQPNIILIQADDLGYDDLGIHGNTMVETPNIDHFARQSVRFSQFYVNPVCAPTRASLMTGRQFLRTGVSHVHGGKDFLNLDETTLAEALKAEGYVTGIWGKWHLGHTEGYFPWERGFDEAFMADLYKYFPCTGRLNGKPFREGSWTTQVLTDFAIDFITRHKDSTFFAYIPYLTCHAPLKAPQEYTDKYLEKNIPGPLAVLYGMVDHMDFHFGRILHHLDTLGLSDNTIVLFMSDNGPAVNNNIFNDSIRAIRYVNRLKGHKGNIWENGVRSPLFVKWGKRIVPKIEDRMVDITDIFPTLVSIAREDKEKSFTNLDGRDISPYFINTDEEVPEKYSYNYANPGWPPTDRPWTPEGIENEYRPVTPEIKQEMNPAAQIISVRSEEYKLLQNPGKVDGQPELINGYALFRIKEDPLEERNLVSEESIVFRELRDKLINWFGEIKNTEGSFGHPVFFIGNPQNHNHTILAKGASAIGENLINTSFDLRNWRTTGDFAEYKIRVIDPGVYYVHIFYQKPVDALYKINLSTGFDNINTAIKNPDSTLAGILSLKKEDNLIRIDVEEVVSSTKEGLTLDKINFIKDK